MPLTTSGAACSLRRSLVQPANIPFKDNYQHVQHGDGMIPVTHGVTTGDWGFNVPLTNSRLA